MSENLSDDILKIKPDNNTFSQHDYASTNVKNNKIFFKSESQISFYNLKFGKLPQMSGVDVLSQSSDEANESKDTENKEDGTIGSDIGNNLTMADSNNIIPESPELSFRSNSLYFSPNLCDFLQIPSFPGCRNIIKSLVTRSTYSTEPDISECSTILESDTEKAISDFRIKDDCLETSQNFHQSLQNITQFSNNTAIAASKPDSILYSNASVNLICSKQISNLQADSDVALSGLNRTCFNELTDTNMHPSNFSLPDVINVIAKIGDNIALEEFLKNQSLKGDFILDNVQFVIDNSMYLGKDMDCMSDNSLHKQLIMKVIRGNSATSGLMSNIIKNLSFQLSAETQTHDTKTPKRESYENKRKDNWSLKYKSQSISSISNKHDTNNFNDLHSQSTCLSLPLSQENTEYVPLPSNIFLSNYCCEYDKAYTKKDLKPVSFRNYYSDKIINSLKNDFDEIITPKQSLEEFFNTTGNRSEKFEYNLHETLNNIVFMLQSELNEHFTTTENLAL